MNLKPLSAQMEQNMSISSPIVAQQIANTLQTTYLSHDSPKGRTSECSDTSKDEYWLWF